MKGIKQKEIVSHPKGIMFLKSVDVFSHVKHVSLFCDLPESIMWKLGVDNIVNYFRIFTINK